MITSQTDPHEARDAVKEDIGNALANLGDMPPSRQRSLAQTKLEEAAHWLSYAPVDGQYPDPRNET